MRSNHDADLREAAGRAGRVVGTRSWPAALGGRTRLVLASALMLFVELALIRWTSSNNLYRAPHQLRAARQLPRHRAGVPQSALARATSSLAPPLLATLVGFVLAFPVRTGTTGTGGWELAGALGMPPLPRPLSLTVIFLLTVAVLMALGQEVARTFACFAPLEAYRLDVLGSLTGIVAFAALSFLRLPPLGWALGAAALFVVLLGRRGVGWPAAGIAAFVLVLGVESVVGPFQWSPYYKIRTQDLSSGSVRVEVNNTPLQTTFSVDQIRRDSPFYLYPYTYAGARDDVLVIGAGTGNDVAVALEEGAKSVDAVEIDPALLQIGRDRHPDRPYSRPPGDGLRGRRPGVHGARRPGVRPHSPRPPRLRDHRHGPVGAEARELPLHDTGAGARAVPAQARRHVRHVQLLRALAAGPLCQHRQHGLRHGTLRAAGPDPRAAPTGGPHPA